VARLFVFGRRRFLSFPSPCAAARTPQSFARIIPIQLSDSRSHSRGALRPSFAPSLASPKRGDGAPGNAGACEAPGAAANHPGTLARRAASSSDRGGAPPGAPFAVFFSPGPRFLRLEAKASVPVQRAPRTGVVVPPGRAPEPPERRFVRPGRRHRICPAFKAPLRRRPSWTG